MLPTPFMVCDGAIGMPAPGPKLALLGAGLGAPL